MTKERHICPTCGQQVLKHKHVFRKSLANLVEFTIKKTGPVHPFHLQKELNLTKNQYNNFQKLQYWGLVKKSFANGKRIGGFWQFTRSAVDLVNGGSVPAWVKTYNNQPVEYSTERTRLSDAIGFYDIPEIWALRSEPIFNLTDKQCD